ncbi:glycosyltransferase [Patescibacteria group bacterium]|nr:glycosyltransferase [Patescibacteria group bacterium]MBU1682462.1 glycosyltransferase [Patescibacteria group bacterium]MBU1935075.1 glycosyltransferase [Patescibacteria group bacterium]
MTKIPKVTIGLVLFEGIQYLKYALPSLVDQDYPNIEYLFRDHSLNGEVYEYIKKELPDVAKKIKLEKGENLMHSGGHNKLINKMTGEYYISASYDMLYEPDFVSKMVNEMEKSEYQNFGSGTCKILKWDFKEAEREDIKRSKTTTIDSVGIGIGKKHGFWDMMQGKDINKFPYLSRNNIDIFGATVALAIYRKRALDDIAYTNNNGEKEYFDKLLHQYNDVDLSYRLQWAGYSCLYMPQATVYHDRQAITDDPEKRKWIRDNSIFGRMVLLKKNYTRDYSWNIRMKTWHANLKHFFDFHISDDDLFDQYKKVKVLKTEINKKRANIIKKKTAKDIEKYIKW